MPLLRITSGARLQPPGAYQDEIDRWIEANEQEAAEASAAWSAGQAAVKQ